MSARKVANQLRVATRTRVSAQTIHRHLYWGRLQARRPYVGVPLTRRHHQDWVNWARNHRRWTQCQWNNILFTDESCFTVDFADGSVCLWRRSGECYHEQNVIQRDRYGGGSVMVWGGITRNTKMDLITVQGTLTAAGNCAQIVQPVNMPFACQRPGVIIQQDNARPHTADVLNNNHVQLLEWPSQSRICLPSSTCATFWDAESENIITSTTFMILSGHCIESGTTSQWQKLIDLFPAWDIGAWLLSHRTAGIHSIDECVNFKIDPSVQYGGLWQIPCRREGCLHLKLSVNRLKMNFGKVSHLLLFSSKRFLCFLSPC